MFRRKIYDKIKEWKDESNGTTALLIEGARRVGKSTVVKEFAKHEYESFALIDFSRASKEMFSLFDDMSDIDRFFTELQFYSRVSLQRRKSVIIFDEVQLCPRARQAIKVLVEDGRFDYIETGSLISIKKNVENILIPSEERKIQMNPMDYEEFLWALGDNSTYENIRKLFLSQKPAGEKLNRQLMRQFRLYMLIGGMPQAIDTYLQTNDLIKVDRIKRDIIDLYEDDFRKIDKTGRLSLLFEAIPSQLNKNSRGFQIKSVTKSYHADDETLLGLISELKDSKTVNVAYYVNNPEIGLSSYKDLQRYKIYLADTGLFITLQFKNSDFTDNIIYQKLLSDKLATNLGYVYENMVGQMLVANGSDLFYHTFENKEQKRNFEVDFILAKKDKLCPIEVKSSSYHKHISLDEFGKKFSERILNRYIIHTKDMKKEQDIICLPFYMTPFLF